MGTRTLALALTLLPAILGTASPAGAQGLQNRAQLGRVNLLRKSLAASADRLYGLAVQHSGATVPEAELISRAAELAGRAHVFGLVVIDPALYLEDARFRGRIDASFERLRGTLKELEAIRPTLPAPIRERLAPCWTELRASYDEVERCWTGRQPGAHTLVGIELQAAAVTARVGEPVPLRVLARLRDGRRRAPEPTAVGWVLRPDRGATIDSAHQFLAREPGIFQVTAVYEEITSPSLAIHVVRAAAGRRLDLTGDFLGYKDRFGLIKSVPCKVPDEAFDAIDIRILERPARIGNIKVHFADGTAAVFWSDQAQALEPGEHRVGSFESKRRILRFDLRSQGEDGFYSRQTIVGVSHGG